MLNILGFIFSFNIGIFIGNIAQTNLFTGITLLLVGILLTVIMPHIHQRIKLFKIFNNQPKEVLSICLEIVGFFIGVMGLIKLNTFMIDVGIIIFLVFFISYIAIKEFIKIFKSSKR